MAEDQKAAYVTHPTTCFDDPSEAHIDPATGACGCLGPCCSVEAGVLCICPACNRSCGDNHAH